MGTRAVRLSCIVVVIALAAAATPAPAGASTARGLDPTFDHDGKALVDGGRGLDQPFGVRRADGDVLVVDVTQAGSRPEIVLALADPAGLAISSFGNHGVSRIEVPAPGLGQLRIDARFLSDGTLAVLGFGGIKTCCDVPFLLHVTPAGQPDPAFGTAGFVFSPSFTDADFSFALGPDGDVVALSLLRVTRRDEIHVRKLLPDGTLDASFGSGGEVVLPYTLSREQTVAIVIDSADRTIIAATDETGGTVTRMLPDGSIDTSFGGGAAHIDRAGGANYMQLYQVLPLADGGVAVLYAQGFKYIWLLRFDAAGQPAGSFGRGGRIRISDLSHVIEDDQGRFILYDGTSGSTQPIASRHLANGALDRTFGTDGFLAPPATLGDINISSWLPDATGAIAVGPAEGDVAVLHVGREGNLDHLQVRDRGWRGDDETSGATVLADGSVLALTTSSQIMRVTADGQRDDSYGRLGVATPVVGPTVASRPLQDIASLPDGRTVVIAEQADDQSRLVLVGLAPDGTVDRTFGADGASPIALPDGFRGRSQLFPRADGTLIVATTDNLQTVLTAFDANGAPDTRFWNAGYRVVPAAAATTVDTQGRIVLAYARRNPSDGQLYVSLRRLRPNGGDDPSFISDTAIVAFRDLKTVATDPLGRILIVTEYDGTTSIARVTATGALDTTFGDNGQVVIDLAPEGGGIDTAPAVVVDPRGRIVIAGSIIRQSGPQPQPIALVIRLVDDGRPDATLGQHGILFVSATRADETDLAAAGVDDFGRVVLVGTARGVPLGGSDVFVVRLAA